MKLSKIISICFLLLITACSQVSEEIEKVPDPKVKTMDDLYVIVKQEKEFIASWKFENKENGTNFVFELYKGYEEMDDIIRYVGVSKANGIMIQAIEQEGNQFNISLNDNIKYFILDQSNQISFFNEKGNLADEGFNIVKIDSTIQYKVKTNP